MLQLKAEKTDIRHIANEHIAQGCWWHILCCMVGPPYWTFCCILCICVFEVHWALHHCSCLTFPELFLLCGRVLFSCWRGARPSWSVVDMIGFTLVGFMSQRTSTFPIEHCTVVRWSMFFTSSVSGFNVNATVYYINILYCIDVLMYLLMCC